MNAVQKTCLVYVVLIAINSLTRPVFAESAQLSSQHQAALEQAGITSEQLAPLLDKPLFQFSEADIDVYLRFLQVYEPNLRKRIVHLARKNIGQPYELYLLGEMPFEHYDPQPIYCLGKSDCVTFSEHTYAMALAEDWKTFMKLLQRIRYWNGELGVATRNHYTEALWNPSNRWLVSDNTAELAGDAIVHFRQKVDLGGFLKRRYKLQVDIAVKQHDDFYLPVEALEQAKPHLEDGDFVNIVRGRLNPQSAGTIHAVSAWVGHVGMIGISTDESGQRKVNLIHSANPKVREEPIDQYVSNSLKNLSELEAAGKPRLLGFKFLHIESDPLANLKEIDGDNAPQVILP